MSDENFRDPKITINRVYTKTGDVGTTVSWGVSRSVIRSTPEAYGTVDELNSCIGMATVTSEELSTNLTSALRRTQNACLIWDQYWQPYRKM